MMAVHWVAGRLFTPSGVTKRVGQFVVGLHLVRRSRSVVPGTEGVDLFPGSRLQRLARAGARKKEGRSAAACRASFGATEKRSAAAPGARWGAKEERERRSAAALGVLGREGEAVGCSVSQVCVSRWGMSESGQGSARRDGACPKVDKGLRVAMGHVRKWTRVCAWRWSVFGIGSDGASSRCHHVDRGLAASDSMYAAD